MVSPRPLGTASHNSSGISAARMKRGHCPAHKPARRDPCGGRRRDGRGYASRKSRRGGAGQDRDQPPPFSIRHFGNPSLDGQKGLVGEGWSEREVNSRLLAKSGPDQRYRKRSLIQFCGKMKVIRKVKIRTTQK